MRKTSRGLWISIVFVGVLILASAAAYLRDVRPTLGLDLEGGVSVVLAAPAGTSRDVMEQSLENIRNRVDAFGVGEPQLFLNANNIEVQIPGLAPGTVLPPRQKTQHCLMGQEGVSYGCAPTKEKAAQALSEIEILSQPTQTCLIGENGEELDCSFTTEAEARSALGLISVRPKDGGQASPALTPSPTSTPAAGPSPADTSGRYCLQGNGDNTYGCFGTRDRAQAALKAVTVRVQEETFCLQQVAPATAGQGATASPSPAASPQATPSASGTATSTPSASPTPGPTVTALSLSDGGRALPCGLSSRDQASGALSVLEVRRQTQVFCVESSAGENLGCRLSQAQAEALKQSTGQERLLQVIGQTARLEERQVLEILPPGSPGFDAAQVTCGTLAEQATPECSFKRLGSREVVFTDGEGNKFRLGRAEVSGTDISKARAQFLTPTQSSLDSGWAIEFELSGAGSDRFADVTRRLLGLPQPTDQLAIVVDRTVISAPTVQGVIDTGIGQITGSFTKAEAQDLATQLNSGALPVELAKQEVQTVSPTLGKESLRQGLIAGIAGLIALAGYLAFYYRLLGVVTWLGMTIWAVLALTVVSILGRTAGYALTLAGIAGLIVSLGVTADSYIVFYERLKDEVRHGKTPRAAIQPAFKRAFRTIVNADIVTFLGAAILYVFAVGSVRGFALTLGLATLLDVFVVYFFKRPTVFLIARNPKLTNLRGFGLTSGVAGEPVPVAGGSE